MAGAGMRALWPDSQGGDVMKWFRHYSDASNDEFIAWIEAEFGLEGYARWWKLLEAIAAQMKPKTEQAAAVYPWPKWQTILRVKRKQLTCFLVACEKQRKINWKATDLLLTIECPKLLEIRDNYTKDWQATDKKLSLDTDTDTDTDKKNKKKKVSVSFSSDFDRLWELYPRKEGRKQAERHFLASVKTPDDLTLFEMALDNYRDHLEANDTPARFIKQGSTFFNNWADWVEPPTTEATFSPADLPMGGLKIANYENAAE
jgi:hypothetical protein